MGVSCAEVVPTCVDYNSQVFLSNLRRGNKEQGMLLEGGGAAVSVCVY